MMKKMKTMFAKIRDRIEKILPMKFGNLVLFALVLYLIFIVGRVIFINYNSNKSIVEEEKKVTSMRDDIQYLEFQINYFQTYSYKEKEAREKLGYIAPGETVVSLPVDQETDKIADSSTVEATIRQPNYLLWFNYFFQKKSQ